MRGKAPVQRVPSPSSGFTKPYLIANLINFASCSRLGERMSLVYIFEAKIVKYSGDRYVIYPPKEYQEKLKQFHGQRIKVIVVKEP